HGGGVVALRGEALHGIGHELRAALLASGGQGSAHGVTVRSLDCAVKKPPLGLDGCSRWRARAETRRSHAARTVAAMETFVVRIWLPDRPGALGQVASRIGAVRGEIVGIDILERGAGRAVDELVVELPDGTLTDL